MIMQKITPHLWFDDDAEEAVSFYISIFENSRVRGSSRYGERGAKSSGRPRESVMTLAFELEGQGFLALNGGPHFRFSPAISFVVYCRTQEEVDELWEKLTDGGEAGRCGWLKDKYGVSWQIVPTAVVELLQDQDPNRSERVMEALLGMTRIDIRRLQQAYDRQ